jgi:ribose/xylose/arabinose/galactoside ABC-type transport system permease subunit
MRKNMDRILAGFQNIWKDLPALPFLILGFILSCFFVRNFASAYNMKVFLLQSVDLLVICCGITFVLLNGGIDFSVTSILSLNSVAGAYIMALSPLSPNPLLSIPVAIAVMLLLGVLVGTINGAAVAYLKMPSFIATLATQLAVSGSAILFRSIVTDKTSITGLPETFFVLGGSGPFFIVPVIIAVLSWLFCFWLLGFTRFGRSLFAVGVNPRVASISGINVKKVIFFIMLLSSIFGAVASILSTARNQVGLPSLGDKLFISVIAAVIVGGTSTAGGFGGLWQTLVGVLFITLINNTLNLLRVEWYAVTVIQGLVILIATIMGSYFQKWEKRVREVKG